MAGKKVAVKDDVIPTASSSKSASNATGSWQAGAPISSEYEKLKLGNNKVIYQVKCTFTFTGTDNSSKAQITLTSSIILSANSTKLQNNFSKALVNGDSKSDADGNKLEIITSSKLSTS